MKENLENSLEELDYNYDSNPKITEPPFVISKGVASSYDKSALLTNRRQPQTQRSNYHTSRNAGISHNNSKTLVGSQSTARISQCFSKHTGGLRQRKGIARVEAELARLSRDYEALVGDGDDEWKSAAQLQRENKKMQEEVKKLNDLVTEFVEMRRLATKRQKVASSSPRPDIEIMKLGNKSKALSNAEDEYMQVTTRVEKVADPQYMKDLKERIVALDHRIKRAEKARKAAETEKMKTGWQFDKVIENGDAQVTRDVNQLRSELTLVTRKIKEIDAALEKKEVTDNEIQERTERLRQSLNELMDVAEKESIKRAVEPVRRKQAIEDPKTEQAKKESLKKVIIMMRKKYTMTLGDYALKKAVLQDKLEPLERALNNKNKTHEEILKELNYLLSKRKVLEAQARQEHIRNIEAKKRRESLLKTKAEKAAAKEAARKAEEEAKAEMQIAMKSVKLKETANARKIQQAWRRRKERIEETNKALAKAREAEELERKGREGLELRRREELERRRREEEIARKDVDGSLELRNSSVMKPIDKGETSNKDSAQEDGEIQDEKEDKQGEEDKQQDGKGKKKRKSKKNKKGIEKEQLLRMGTNPLEALLALEQEGADFMGELYGSGKPRRKVMPKDSKTALKLLESIKF
eukprot:TRINITY_DN422_c0_g1_i14.p1 TRINITY_DN422_c0_g1~~TRINITY_DN422_c0_g1_i14.p1  ORF type:complete len:640 (-),score=244.06 TRINITY_DN422_c0_g1_i14:139-2058(-)